jgi:hypothetical protein
MVYFQTKNPNLGNFWRALDWKMLLSFLAIRNILRTFRKCYARLIHFVLIWYIFPTLVSRTKKNLATLAENPRRLPKDAHNEIMLRRKWAKLVSVPG